MPVQLFLRPVRFLSFLLGNPLLGARMEPGYRADLNEPKKSNSQQMRPLMRPGGCQGARVGVGICERETPWSGVQPFVASRNHIGSRHASSRSRAMVNAYEERCDLHRKMNGWKKKGGGQHTLTNDSRPDLPNHGSDAALLGVLRPDGKLKAVNLLRAQSGALAQLELGLT